TWVLTGAASAESPGRAPMRLVAFVGNGTVSEVPPVMAGAPACPNTTPLRMKITTCEPEPPSAKPPPAMVNVAGGLRRSIELGVMLDTQGGVQVREAETSSVMPPMSL